MAFGLFSNRKSDTEKQKGTFSFLNKLTTQSASKPNSSLVHDFDDENSFSVPSNKDLFANVHLNDNLNFQQENMSADISFNQDITDPKIEQNSNTDPYSALAPNQEDDSIRSKYYTYAGDESYLNEEGRDNDHLYIGPGEPLTPKRRKVEQQAEDTKPQTEDKANPLNLSENTAVQGNVENIKESSAKEDDQFLFSNDKQNLTSSFERELIDRAPRFEKTVDAKNNPFNESTDSQYYKTESEFGANQVNSLNSVLKNSFEETNAHNNDKNLSEKKKSVGAPLLTVLFFRKLFASLFTYTNLGAVFTRSSMNYFGPSSPSFMIVPYFIAGFICAIGAMFFAKIANPFLSSSVAFTIYVLITGCNGFSGIGTLISTISLRKIDFYAKALIVLVVMQIFIACFDRFLEVYKIDTLFALGFAVMTMLAAFTAATLNYGHKDDPVSTYGSLSLRGLVINSVIVLSVTFTVLDWQIALSMIGICLFARVSIGQYMYIKDLNAGIANVCAVKLITLILLMLDLTFASSELPFISALLKS